jgi:hypothetical protein
MTAIGTTKVKTNRVASAIDGEDTSRDSPMGIQSTRAVGRIITLRAARHRGGSNPLRWCLSALLLLHGHKESA